ncbi:SusC/RagA family TonB-linked outer membrane protein [Joostella atrarenae]|uniref:SusC/RagA family TonB-linked outer membrane protein n=1 Tax=Joostella atrarenae TaxID=679257 RepID=A0ABS9J532_9FLAO|nr:SusC/RagA family TonB-linked outer membrane protein [Joostella atrarenae]MCF8715520.1 SusC/RagA family TonB-linked outer membrane protein [Joostella atrarenae]
MKKLFFTFFYFLLCLHIGLAQEKNITGIVTDFESGMPIPGATVVEVGTSNGVTTDFDGKFSIDVMATSNIEVSYLGFSQQTIDVGSQVFFEILLKAESSSLSEVVVTALGIKREKKAIGYAMDQLSSEQINSTGEPNVLLNLSAKAPGVQVSGSANGVDGSPRVIIRGVTSLSSDNQPLYVLDGLPLLSNRSLSESIFTSSSGASDLGNPISDINPNDIESISILKGASASALYGSRGANGVVMITTKKGNKGQKGWGANFSSSTTIQDPLILPRPQLKYGQGFDGEYEYVDGNGFGVNESTTNLWGPEFLGQPIAQWNPENGDAIVKPWLPYGANNLDNFFESGHTIQNNLSLSYVDEKSNARLSLGHQNIEGIAPNTGLERITGSFNSNFQLGEDLSLTFVATGSTMDSDNRTFYGGSGALWQALFIPTNIDIRDLKDYKDELGNKKSFYEGGPNPYWDLYENQNPVNRDRFSYNIGLTYNLLESLSIQGNIFKDTNIYEYERVQAKHLYNQGSYQEGLDVNKELNTDIRVTFNNSIFKDFDYNMMVGAASRRQSSNNKYSSTDGGLLVRDVYNLGNSAKQPLVSNRTSEKEVNSIFGSIEVDYNNFVFLTVTGRNDWSSTLPSEDWSFFYPSISSGIILSEIFNFQDSFNNYFKLRASWAKVGNDTQPYALSRYINRNSSSFNGQPVLGIDNVIPATSLKPEESVSYELGGELYFLNSRVKLDIAYYENESSNQLIRIENAWERGARYAFINAGTITNKGVEVKLDLGLIQSPEFKWDVSLNWSMNDGVVSGFPSDLVDFKHIAAWSGPEIRATNGEPYGHIVGFEYFRDSQEALNNVPNMSDDFIAYGYTAEDNIYGTGEVLTRDGMPMHNVWRGTRDLGAIAPLDWSSGITNTFSYKNFGMSFLFDVRKGGHVISTTYQSMSLSGMNPDSAGVNDNGIPVRESIDQGGGYIFDGVDVETGQENSVAVNSQDLFSNYNYPTSELMRSATNIKLKELSFSYRFDSNIVDRLGISGMSLSLVGRNLWLIKNNLDGIDTETANMGSLNNGTGFEYGSLPNTRSMGITLSVDF